MEFLSGRKSVTFACVLCRSLKRYYSKEVVQNALDNYVDITFRPFCVDGYVLGKSFSQAHVGVQPYIINNKTGIPIDSKTVTDEQIINREVVTPHLYFSDLFKTGLDALKQYAEGKQIEDEALLVPFVSFATGLLTCNRRDFHASCIWNGLKRSTGKLLEAKVSVILANHLFSRLVADYDQVQTYSVSNDKGAFYETCPCGFCGSTIYYDMTGIGSEYLWYGKPDIMVYPLAEGGHINIVMPVDDVEDGSWDNDNLEFRIDKQLVEIKPDARTLRTDKNIEQIVSQTITFSMYQKMCQKRKKMKSEVSLIPTIATGAEHFDIYLYDWKHDVLLRNVGDPIPFFENSMVNGEGYKPFKLSSLILLWVLINNFPIKPFISNKDLKQVGRTCNFLTSIPPKQLENIEKTVTMQGRFSPFGIDKREYFAPLSQSVLPEPD